MGDPEAVMWWGWCGCVSPAAVYAAAWPNSAGCWAANASWALNSKLGFIPGPPCPAAAPVNKDRGGPGARRGCPPEAPGYSPCGYRYGSKWGGGCMGGPTEMFGDG